MLDHLLESSHWDDSNKWSNIGFGDEIKQVGLIEVKIYEPYLELYFWFFYQSEGSYGLHCLKNSLSVLALIELNNCNQNIHFH